MTVGRVHGDQQPPIRVLLRRRTVRLRVRFRATHLQVVNTLLSLLAAVAATTARQDLAHEVAAERHVDPRVAAAVEARQQQAHYERVGCKQQAELVSRLSPGGATMWRSFHSRFYELLNPILLFKICLRLYV